MRDLGGTLDGQQLHVAIVVSRYNETVTSGLLQGARVALSTCGVPEAAVTVVRVPGALELALAAQELAALGAHDAIVALGAVIRGETGHYEHVCTETARGCARVALDSGVPVAFGVLTCDTLSQARDRAATTPKNKGAEAARTAVEMANLLRLLRAPEGAGAVAP